MIFWIINKILTAYILSTSIFLFIILFNKLSRKRRNIFLHKSNIIIIVILLVNIILAGAETIKCKISEVKNVTDNTQNSIINYKEHCISIFVFTLLFAFLFQTLFLFHKFRIKISFTVISIFLLAVYNNYEIVMIFITSLFRDYLPSSWSTYYNNGSQIWTVAFTTVYFITCWINKPTSILTK
jgi:hypothetical protein